MFLLLNQQSREQSLDDLLPVIERCKDEQLLQHSEGNSTSMCICLCIYKHAYIYVHINIYLYMCMCMYIVHARTMKCSMFSFHSYILFKLISITIVCDPSVGHSATCFSN